MNIESIKIALESMAVGKLRIDAKLKEVERLIIYAYDMKGQQHLSKDKMEIAVTTIEGKLSSEYNYLTLGELQIIVDAGLAGELTSSTIVNPANILGWIAVYVKCAERADALKAVIAKRNASTQKFIGNLTSAEVAERNAEDEANEPGRAYQRYLKDGRSDFHLAGYTAHLYDALRKRGYMQTISQDSLKTAQENAKKAMAKDLSKSALERFANCATTEETYIKQELVFMYFDALKQAGRATI